MGALTPEGKVKRKVVDMLKREGIWYFMPVLHGMGRSGVPDIVCIVNGLFVGIECKSDPGKKPTSLQQLCAKQIQKSGGYWFLVSDDETLEKVEKWIEERKGAGN